MNINELIKLPESHTLEYKRDTSNLDSILKTIVAFANTAGGLIVIGVDDDKSIRGLPAIDKTQEQLANAIAHRIMPQILPEFTVEPFNQLSLLVIQVDYSPDPYFLGRPGGKKEAYIRLGNSNRQATKERVAEMERMHHCPFFDRGPCGSATEQDLDNTAMTSFLPSKALPISQEKLLSLGLITKRGKEHLASNAAIILFGQAKAREHYFPFAQVRCARFKGSTRAEFIDQLTIPSILEAVEAVPLFIRRNTRMASQFGRMQRQDIPEYPFEGLREALINAFVHTNYEIPGSRIFVGIYDDHLEIQNPGIMPPGMGIDQFKAGISSIRNPVIARIFKEKRLMEEWGSGYQRIKQACEQGGYPEPDWQEFGTALRVTFYPHPEIATKSQLGAKTGTKLAPSWHQADKEQSAVLNFCLEARSTQEIMTFMGWKDRTKFRQKFIQPLLAKGMIQMTVLDKPKSPHQKYKTTMLGANLFNQEEN